MSNEEINIYEKLIDCIDQSVQSLDKNSFYPVDFEKDDDSNYHIDFIHATANLRARNYRIEEWNQLKTKLIAGKIIPAVATTTAMIVGAVGIEMMKVVQGFNSLEDFRNTFVNLGVSLFVFTEPSPAKKTEDLEHDPLMMNNPTKAIPSGFTIWDTIEIKGPLTVQNMIDLIKDTYNVNVSLISTGKYSIYNEYLPSKKHLSKLPMLIEDICRANGIIQDGKNFITIGIGGSTVEDNIDCKMPIIKYIFE